MLAFVPARGGSKEVPQKNLALLGGKPLIAHTLQAAQDSQHITQIFVSTDNEAIAECCESLGVSVPYRRPVELASNSANTRDAVLHGLAWLEAQRAALNKPIVLLQPTSPFRTARHIDLAFAKFLELRAESLVSVSPVTESPYNLVEIDNKSCTFLLDQSGLPRPRQDFERTFYVINGAIFMFSREFINRENRFVVEDKTLPYIIERPYGFDIDSLEDLIIARALFDHGLVSQ